MEQRKFIRAEKVPGRLLSIVYDGGGLGKEVLELFRKRGLRVVFVNSTEADFPVLEKPNYVVFFAGSEVKNERLQHDWREAIVTAKRNKAKLFLCLDNVPSGISERLMKEARDEDWKTVEIKISGEFISKEEIALAAGKIIHEVFSGQNSGKLLLSGKESAVTKFRQYTSNVSDRPVREYEYRPSQRKGTNAGMGKFLVIASLVIIIVFAPLLAATAVAALGMVQLRSGESLLVRGKFDEAKSEADKAGSQLETASNIISSWTSATGWIGLGGAGEKFYDVLLVGKSGARSLGHIAVIAKTANSMMGRMVLGTNGSDVATGVNTISPELAALDSELGLVEGQWTAISGIASTLAPWMGITGDKLTDVPQKISSARSLISKTNAFLGAMSQITGQTESEKKTYLVVLQNSSELRPTGGFIGSYAIVSFDSGRLLDFKINDIYSADGQLRGSIQPPDEILHYLGQPGWFMRDANWAADWPLTAKRLEWFLEKETGEKVAGVWAVSLPAVQKMLVATGPLDLPDMDETVSATDFYHKAEYTAEINFFPGSTQKKDFLGATAQALIEKLTNGENKNWIKLAQATGEALVQKDIMAYFEDESVQNRMEATGWGGTITGGGCTQPKANCLMLVDANLGANKSNFFLSRSVGVDVAIGKGGEVENHVTVRYQNNSPSESWPGGTYKDFVRFLVPKDAELTGMDLGDFRKPTISPILTAEVIAKTAPDQFLVFKNNELTGKSQGASDSAWLSFGTFFEIPVGQSKTVTFSYRPNIKVNFAAKQPMLAMTILRQPGAGVDPLSLVVDFPDFLAPDEVLENGVTEKAGEGPKLLVFPQKLSYNTDLSQDRSIKVSFQGGQ